MKKIAKTKNKETKEVNKPIADIPHKTLSSSRLRKLLGIILAAPSPQLRKITECDGDGEIKFSVLIEDIGLTMDEFKEFRHEVFSSMFVETLGELLIRENMDDFMDHLTSLPAEEYDDLFSRHNHFCFGMKIYRGRLEFAFHISLIRNILTEDFKNITRNK